MTLLSKLTLAQSVSANDQIAIDQGNPPVTRRASLATIFGNYYLNINRQVASYTAVLSDSLNTLIRITNASANICTIPPNSAVPFPIGSVLLLRQGGLGQTGFAAGAGVTLLNGSSNNCRTQYALIGAIQEDLNVWSVCGDML